MPLLTSAGLQYVGGFRLPRESSNGDSFSFGGKQLAFNPATNTLFVGSRAGRVAEVSIPTAVNSPDANALPFASFVQAFADPTEGHLSQVATSGVAIDGLMIHGNRLVGTASIYYDAQNTQRVSHYSHSLQLSQASFTGWSQVWEMGKTGFVSGYVAPVPAEWQAALGGPAITGQCCIPIVTRTSWGPAAFAFDPSTISAGGAVSATPLLYYTGEHPTLGTWEGSNPTYGGTTKIGGLAIVAGTRTALYFGRTGTGPYCYGNGTGDQSLHGKLGADGAMWCYDPTASAKGSHAYPYVYQVWAYDLNDFAAVRQGAKAPWDVVPYGVWPLNLPTPELSVTVGGVGYDSAKQMLYVSQMYADRDGYANRPVVHAFRLAAPTTDPPPTGTVQVSVQSDKPSPQTVQTSIAFTAQASGTTVPVEYRWAVHDGTTFTNATPWSPSTQFSWTPQAANLNYRVSVGVRKSGNTSDTPEATASLTYPINNSASARISSVSLVSNMTSPQPLNTPVGFTATATGGTAPYEYKWLVYDGSWRAITGWSSLSGFTWTPSTAMTYAVGVWARSAGNTNDEPEGSKSVPFTISPPSASRVSAVSMAASVPSPQQVGRSITFTATATGGSSPIQYKWLVNDGGQSMTLSGWSTQNTFTWTPGTANSNYSVSVWARSDGSTSDEPEASTSMPYAITTVTPPPAATVNSVTLSTNRPAPQKVGTTITATATVAGGVSPYSFKWLIDDGKTVTVMTGWVPSNTFDWTPTTFDPNYKIIVWVRSAGNARDEAEATSALQFRIMK